MLLYIRNRFVFFVLSALISLFSLSAVAVEISGVLLSADETPLQDGKIWLWQSEKALKVLSDETGHFQFKNVPVGDTNLIAYKEGYAVGGIHQFVVEDFSVKIYLPPAETLQLRVINNTFEELPGVRVKSLLVGDSFFLPVEELSKLDFPQVRSDEKGLLTLPWLPRKSFVKMVLTHYQYADSAISYLPVGGERQNIVLYPGVKVVGRVLHDNKPVSNARVTAFQRSLNMQRDFATTFTDPEGCFSLRLAEGSYALRAQHTDFAAAPPQNLKVLQDQEAPPVTLQLHAPHYIRGEIRFVDESPSPGVCVQYYMGEQLQEEACTDGKGKFELKVAGAKGMLLVVPPSGFMTQALPRIPVDMGTETAAEIKPLYLSELPLISGTIIDQEGEPVPNVLVSSQNQETPIWVLTDEKGAFQFRLAYAPEESKLYFRAEHPLRFLRRDFKVHLRHLEPITVRLKPFEPDSKVRKPIPGRNNLTALIGEDAPEIRCSDWFNTPPLDAEALKGKVVVITFWGGFDDSALGCARIEEMRAHADLLREVDDVIFLAVHDAGNDADEVENYIHQRHITFPAARDADPFFSFVNYGVNFIPQTVLIDRQGKLRYAETEGRLLELIKVLRRAR